MLMTEKVQPVINGKVAPGTARKAETFPVIMKSIEQDGRCLRFKKPFTFSPFVDNSTKMIMVEERRLGICVYAETRADVLNDLKAEILFLWDEYATADDDSLSNDAMELKNNLLSVLEPSNG